MPHSYISVRSCPVILGAASVIIIVVTAITRALITAATALMVMGPIRHTAAITPMLDIPAIRMGIRSLS